MSGLINFLSRISIRLLVFNLLLVFLPIMGILYLDTYEKQLLKAQENLMVQQGRLLSAALSINSNFNSKTAKELISQLKSRVVSRLRILDIKGKLLADSSRPGNEKEDTYNISANRTANSSANISANSNANNSANSSADTSANTSNNGRLSSLSSRSQSNPKKAEKNKWLYELATLPIRSYRKIFNPPQPVYEPADFYGYGKPILGHEVIAALNGRYGSITRLSAGGQRSVTLYSAIPIWKNNDDVIGAVLVSQSTFQILKNLYEIRLGIFRIFLASISAAIILSLLLSTTIARPLRKLKNEAGIILDHKGRLTKLFMPSKRRDEIGKLSRSLAELTRRLKKNIRFTESFAADLSHEFRNPLASIRSAAEIIQETRKHDEKNHFLQMVFKNVRRMEYLLSGAREITRIDISMEEDKREPVILNSLLTNIVEGFKLRYKKIHFRTKIVNEPLQVLANADRLVQVFENIIDNAVSFSKNDDTVTVDLKQCNRKAIITVSDQGPGIPGGHLEKIFDRFFCFRPEYKPGEKFNTEQTEHIEHTKQTKHIEHTGIGLSIVKSIVQGYSGTISAENLNTGNLNTDTGNLQECKNSGAKFIIILPLLSASFSASLKSKSSSKAFT